MMFSMPSCALVACCFQSAPCTLFITLAHCMQVVPTLIPLNNHHARDRLKIRFPICRTLSPAAAPTLATRRVRGLDFCSPTLNLDFPANASTKVTYLY